MDNFSRDSTGIFTARGYTTTLKAEVVRLILASRLYNSIRIRREARIVGGHKKQ